MSKSRAERAIEWSIDRGAIDPNERDTTIYFWGGEPFMAWKTMLHTLERYPQLFFCTNTNGVAINDSNSDILRQHMYHFRVTLSLGSAYDKFGGIDKALVRLKPAIDLIKESHGGWGVNFTVDNVDRMYEDFVMMHESGIHNILIDMPTHREITAEYQEKFIDAYLKILFGFHKDKNSGFKFFDKHMSEEMAEKPKRLRYCGSGVTRLLVDFDGDVYPCDGMYIVKRMKLGNIYKEVDFSKLTMLERLADNPEKLYMYCNDCEIGDVCPRAKCMGMNIELTGNMFKPDPNWCMICKTYAKLNQKYHELKREKSYETSNI